MKKIVAILSAVAISGLLMGFDSGSWLEKRQMLDHEAERLSIVHGECEKMLQEPAEDVVVPIEAFPSGRIKSQIRAKKAEYFIEKGLVWGKDITLEEYDEQGLLRGKIDAQSCVVDRDTRSGWAKGHVKAVYGGNILEGDGIYFSFAEEYIKISTNSVIQSLDAKIKGVKL